MGFDLEPACTGFNRCQHHQPNAGRGGAFPAASQHALAVFERRDERIKMLKIVMVTWGMRCGNGIEAGEATSGCSPGAWRCGSTGEQVGSFSAGASASTTATAMQARVLVKLRVFRKLLMLFDLKALPEERFLKER
jgi:hypothetical protein